MSAEPLLETGLQRVVGRPAEVCVHRDDAPVRVRAVGSIGKRQVGAGGRVEQHVDVIDDVLFVRPFAVHVVGLDSHRAAELPLDADRALKCARQVNVLRRAHELLQIADETSGRIVVGVTEPLDGLLVGRQRSAVGRVRGKIGSAVIGVIDDDQLGVARRKRLIGADRVAIVKA